MEIDNSELSQGEREIYGYIENEYIPRIPLKDRPEAAAMRDFIPENLNSIVL